MLGRATIKNDTATGKKMPMGVRCTAPAKGNSNMKNLFYQRPCRNRCIRSRVALFDEFNELVADSLIENADFWLPLGVALRRVLARIDRERATGAAGALVEIERTGSCG